MVLVFWNHLVFGRWRDVSCIPETFLYSGGGVMVLVFWEPSCIREVA